MDRNERPLFSTQGFITRRKFLKLALATGVVGASPAWAKAASERKLAFEHLHTGERLSIVYYRNGTYDDVSLAAINHILRDFRTNDIFAIEPRLLDQLHRVHSAIGSDAPFQVISGYRSPATNDMLHRTTSGVASRSLHMDGRAIDVRLVDSRTRHLRAVAAKLRLGGVGYYAASDFVHLDTGRPRQW